MFNLCTNTQNISLQNVKGFVHDLVEFRLKLKEEFIIIIIITSSINVAVKQDAETDRRNSTMCCRGIRLPYGWFTQLIATNLNIINEESSQMS